jgi:endo-1,4-beta-xylanase
MKKFLALALTVLMAVSMIASVSAAKKSFEAGTGTPVIDGKLDDAYSVSTAIAVNVKTSGDGKTSGVARVLWDEKNIYVFFDVTDPILSPASDDATFWHNDSVEFMMNLSGQAKGKTTALNAGQYTATPNTGKIAGTWAGYGKHYDANKAQAKYATQITAKGYTVEYQVPWGKDYTPKADAVIGMAFHINSDEDGKTTGGSSGRDGEYFANEGQSAAWSDVDSYDDMKLTSKKFVPTTAAPATTKAAATAKAATTTAAKTADAGIVVAMVAVVALGSAVIVSKKRK